MKPNERTKEYIDLHSRRVANVGERLGSNFSNYSRVRISLAHLAVPVALLLLASLVGSRSISAAETASQQVFSSPAAAASALVAASKADDMKTLNFILGPEADQITSSGDQVADNDARDNFVRRYQEMHRLAYDGQGQVVLYIGANNWPVPIPLVKKNGGWVFDTAAGKEELLQRRIGRNELFAIDVLEDLSEAQEEYASEARDGGSVRQFARKIMSDPNKQNGLYWEAVEGQPESPMGPLVASAAAEGYTSAKGGNPIPFHGYYYKVLTRQGRNAPGGAKN